MSVTLKSLTERLELADQLLAGRSTMFEPQDLPGNYGLVIKAVDHVLGAIVCESVVAGGWAVWHYGFDGRVTQDVDIVLAVDRIDEFLRAAAVSGFELLPQPADRWPKVVHKQTAIRVGILPEGARPGTASRPAPTTIPHPRKMGAAGSSLRYITLPSLIELKLAADRLRDVCDILELIRQNWSRVDEIRQHLATVHASYPLAFDALVQRAREEQDH